MEWYQIIMVTIAIAGITAVPLVAGIKSSIKEQSNKLDAHIMAFQNHQLHISERYVTQDALKDHLERIEKGISELKVMMREER